MTIFDLVFAVLFLTGLVSLLVALTAVLRGKRARALAILRQFGIVATLYFTALILVSAVSPQRFLRVSEDQCSDDWCIAVQSVHRDTAGVEIRYDVAFRLSNRARRAAQRERFVAVYLRDVRGHRYAPMDDASAAPFDTLLSPMQVITMSRRFTVLAETNIVGLVVVRAGGGRFPGCCVIGDQGSLFHRRAIVRLD